MGDLRGLASVDVESGVSLFTGEPFCSVTATDTTGAVFAGQLTPAEVRTMAEGFIGAAEAAEQEANLLEFLTELVDDKNKAAFVLAELRRRLRAKRPS